MADHSDHLNLSITIGGSSFSGAGPADQVTAAMDKFTDLLAAQGSEPPPRPPATDEKDETSDPPGDKPAPPAGVGEKVPFGVFMKRKFPNQHATAAAIFTWAKRYDGKESMKPGEMETYWKKVLKKPGNPTAVCQNAEKQGWLENVGGGQYAITGHGEKSVDRLPAAEED
jgi:hypothetical protein